MSRLRTCLLAAAGLSLAAPSRAAIVQRFAAEQRGGFVLLGNTLAQDCAPSVADPLVGNVGACGENADDTGADVLWSVTDGSASAGTGVSAAEASSVAVLVLPEGARVTHAALYWSAEGGPRAADGASLSRSGAFEQTLTADRSLTSTLDDVQFYQSVADVTALVQEHGAGAYQLGNIDAADPVDVEDTSFYAGWWMVVFYALDSEPVRSLTLVDGLELVTDGNSRSATLGGFRIPPGAVDATLGVVAFEGDGTADGDQLRFGAAAPLGAGAALDGSDNFFDGSRSGPDGPLSVPGDLPRLSGASETHSGMDLHVVDVSDALDPGQSSAEVQGFSSADRYFLAGLVLAVNTSVPDLTLSSESVRDVNGPPLLAGDELEYSITVRNDGNAAAAQAVLSEVLPAGTSYVAGSLEVVSGAGAGLLTDAAQDDAGELDTSASPGIVARLGTGASATAGGSLAPGQSSVVRYRVLLAADATGTLQSQARVIAVTELGATPVSVLADADPVAPGASPTLVVIDACASDTECAPSGGHCDLAQTPTACVECLEDAHCSGLVPSCDLSVQRCVCIPTGLEEAQCDGKDDDCDGVIDEGFAGEPCSAGEGECAAAGVTICDASGAPVCDAVPLAPAVEQCGDDADEDCDGLADALDPDCASPEQGGGGDDPSLPADDDGTGGLEPEPVPGAGEEPLPGRPEVPGPRGEGITPGSAASLGGGGGSCQIGSATASGVWAWLGSGTALFALRRRGRATAAGMTFVRKRCR